MNSFTSCKLKQRTWDIDLILPKACLLDNPFIIMADSDRHINFIQLLSRDVYSEGDSKCLYEYLRTRYSEFSVEFRHSLEIWIVDELKHYDALKRLYQLVAGVTEEEINNAFENRHHELDPLNLLLEDEFTILVSFLFDELGSTISYRRDLREYYSHYGFNISCLARHLVMDEGCHFQNAVQVILHNHSQRIHEIPQILENISKLERSLGRYCKTFFLDHAQEHQRFPCDFNEIIIDIILAHFNLCPHPRNTSFLWQANTNPMGFTLAN